MGVDVAAGELRGGIALTEPDCGTDLQAIRTRADKQGDAYVINGTKQWITNSVQGNVLAVLVKISSCCCLLTLLSPRAPVS